MRAREEAAGPRAEKPHLAIMARKVEMKGPPVRSLLGDKHRDFSPHGLGDSYREEAAGSVQAHM